ncbi:MAG: hypothetical protein RML45_05985 [Acetobacteraceae bacterium]|nr:hypothetical protein [Acetobacteraceae bacterium]
MTAASDLARVRGTFAYAIDFALPGMLHAALVRSPHPHAEILAIDAATALNEPGVVAVATGDDLAGLDPWQGVVVRDQPLLAIGKVRYAGEPVAAVVARDPRSAARAAARVTVRWRLLPPVPTIEAALAPDAPALFDQGPPEHLPERAWRGVMARARAQHPLAVPLPLRRRRVRLRPRRPCVHRHLPVPAHEPPADRAPLCGRALGRDGGRGVVQQPGSVPAAHRPRAYLRAARGGDQGACPAGGSGLRGEVLSRSTRRWRCSSLASPAPPFGWRSPGTR